MRIVLFVLTTSIFILIPKVAFANSALLNEIMANPNDDTEWVELYNPTDQVIDLANWKIKDGNSITSDDLTLSGQINPSSFITFDHAKGWLNDSGTETITLLDNNNQTLDSYSYSGTTKGKTFGRQPDGQNWIASLDPSKNSSNGEQPTPTPSPTSTPTASPSPTTTPTPTSSPTPTSTAKKSTSPTIAPTSTLNPSSQATPQPKSYNKLVYRSASVAGITKSATSSATPAAEVKIKSQRESNPLIWVGIIFIFAGAGAIGYIYLKKNAKIHF